MDIADLDVVAAADGGAEVELMHPAHGTPLGIKIEVRGFDSPEVLAAGREASKAVMAKGVKGIEGAIDSRRLAMAKAAIIAVSGMEFEGNKITTNKQLGPILERPSHEWIADQIIQFGGDRVNFFPKPPSS